MARKRRRVDLTDAARRDLASIQARIAGDNPLAATKWLRGVQRRILSLGSMPERFEVIPELADESFEFEYRHYLFGTHRIIYRVEEARVLVARIVRAARILTPQMLQE